MGQSSTGGVCADVALTHTANIGLLLKHLSKGKLVVSCMLL